MGDRPAVFAAKRGPWEAHALDESLDFYGWLGSHVGNRDGHDEIDHHADAADALRRNAEEILVLSSL